MNRYVLAIFACLGILVAYVAIALMLGWRHGGGFLPGVLLIMAIGGAWKVITAKKSASNQADIQTAEPLPVERNNNDYITEQEEDAYQQAQSEYDKGDIRKGLWTKATCEETDPDNQRRKYIKYRAAQIHSKQTQIEYAARRNQSKIARTYWTRAVLKCLAFLIALGVAHFCAITVAVFADDYTYHEHHELPIGLILLSFAFWTIYTIILYYGNRNKYHFILSYALFAIFPIDMKLHTHNLIAIPMIGGWLYIIVYVILMMIRASKGRRA